MKLYESGNKTDCGSPSCALSTAHKHRPGQRTCTCSKVSPHTTHRCTQHTHKIDTGACSVLTLTLTRERKLCFDFDRCRASAGGC